MFVLSASPFFASGIWPSNFPVTGMHPYNVTSNPPRFLIGDWCDCRHLVATSGRQLTSGRWSLNSTRMTAEIGKFGSTPCCFGCHHTEPVNRSSCLPWWNNSTSSEYGRPSNEVGEEIRAHAIGDGHYEAEHVDELRLRRVFQAAAVGIQQQSEPQQECAKSRAKGP